MRDFYTKDNMQGALFHVPDAGLFFEPAELSFETEPETGREGVIRVRHREGRPARGYVYPSERCMRGVREQFAPAADGTGYIRWQFDSRGIAPGRTVCGFFRVISPFGEYKIPYTVQISGKGETGRKRPFQRNIQRSIYADTAADRLRDSQGKQSLKRLNRTAGRTAASRNVDFTLVEEKKEDLPAVTTKQDFLSLAETDLQAAADLFYSSRFEKILSEAEDRTLYRGLSMMKGNLQNVEEFLISACGKEKTVFEPVEKALFLETQGTARRADTRMAGTRAERALEAHRQRVRNRGGAKAAAPGQARTADEDLLYIPLRIRRKGTARTGLTIVPEGRFLSQTPFEVPLDTMFGNRQEKESGDLSISGQEDAAREHSAGTAPAVPGLSGRGDAADAGREGSAGTAPEGLRAAGKDDSGTVFTVRIPVSRAALHAGVNLGRVLVRGPFNEASVPVEVRCRSSVPSAVRKKERELRLLELQLMRLYVDYRLSDSRAHRELEAQALRLIDELTLLYRGDLFPRLYRVHLMILRGQYLEAEKELARLAVRYAGQEKAQNFSLRFTGEQEGAYCYRQYLYARCRTGDTQLCTRTARFLRGVYRTSGSWQTAWMLMDLSEEYAPGTGARWNFLRHQYESGCSSPVIWIEAWEMVRENPQILLPGSSVQERWVRDDFGLHVLWYAAGNNVLTARAAEVMISLAEKKKQFSALLYKGLCAAAEQESLAEMKPQLLRAVCILLIRGQNISAKAHAWYVRAMEAGVNLTNLEEYRERSAPPDDAFYRLPAGFNAVLRTTAARAVQAVLVYDHFRGEEVFPIRDGAAPVRVYGSANTFFLEDESGNRCASSLPYALDLQQEDPAQNRLPGDLHALAYAIGFGDRKEKRAAGVSPSEEEPFLPPAGAAGKLLDSGLLTKEASAELLLLCLNGCRRQLTGEAQTQTVEERKKEGDREHPVTAGEKIHFYLSKADPSQCGAAERAVFLDFMAEAGEYEMAVRWLTAYGSEGVGAGLLGTIALGLPWEGGYASVLIPAGWEAFLKGNTGKELLERLSDNMTGLSEELCRLRSVCSDRGIAVSHLDERIVRQSLYSGAVSQAHAAVLVSAGEKLGEALPPAAAQYADYAFSNGISMGNRVTDLIMKLLLDEGNKAEDICRIAFLKELSMRQGEYSPRERTAAAAALSVLLSKGIIFPFYRQFPGFDDRLDLYAEETLVQYHPASAEGSGRRHIVFHYTASRRGEIGNYRSRLMKEMYRDFYVSGFLLFYGEQMHYYITDDPEEKHVVQSGMIGQDARILDNCSGRFGLINDTTRAAALRDYDEAISLLAGYYRRSYLESELFRR